MATVRAGKAVVAPNLGLYLDRPKLMIPERGLSASMNVRIENAQVIYDQMGWSPFPDESSPLNLDNKPVMLIDSFTARDATTKTIFGNTTDLFEWDDTNEVALYLTPRYETGTVSVTNSSTTVTGTGTSWASEAKAGDFIHIGSAGERDPASEWYEIANVVDDTEITLASAYTGSTDSGLDYTLRQTFAGDVTDPFHTETFFGGESHTEGSDGDRWYATNGIDAVVAWDGSTDQVYLPDLGNIGTCLSLRRYKNVMLYISPRVSGELRSFSIRTSAIGQPENVSTLEASEFVVHDGSDPLVTAEQIGELLAIYSKRTITLAQYVGPPLMYVFRTAVSGYGLRGSRGLAKFPDHHLFLGHDGLYRFDGVAARPWATHVWKEVTRQISPQRQNAILPFFDESRGELHWVVPLNSDDDSDDGPPEIAYTLHYLEDVGEQNPQPYTRRELPATALGNYERVSSLTWAQLTDEWQNYNFRWNDQFFQASFPFVLFGDVDGNVYTLNGANTQAGEPITAMARFSRRPIVDSRTNGILKRIYPYIETIQSADHDLTVRVRTFDAANTDTPRFTVDETVAVAPGNDRFASFRVPGRYVEVEFRSEGDKPWQIAGYDLDFAIGGQR